MEITGLDKTQSVKKVQPKKAVGVGPVEDKITLSPESQKMGEWVDMLKQMPDVRPEKIASALGSSPTARELAHKMLNEI